MSPSNIPGRFQNVAYVLLRMVAGFNLAVHGVQKLFGLFGSRMAHFPSQYWLGGVIELGCGLAIALGWGTRWAAFLASGTMAVAYVQFSWKLQTGAMLLPVVNKGELALVYCFLFLYLCTRGNGPWSLGRS